MEIVRKNQPKPAGKVDDEDMLQEIIVKDNIVQNELPLMNGSYIIWVIPNHEKSRKAWEQYWFSIIDSYCLHSGNDRYEIHNMFKEHYKISSTKELITDADWQKAVNELKVWTIINS